MTTWQMNYPRTAKKMDMQRLNSIMWNILCGQVRNCFMFINENTLVLFLCNSCLFVLQSDQLNSLERSKPKYFSTTYNQVPNLLPQRIADNLSVPLAFASILHLATENNLELQQKYGNLDDFVVLHSSRKSGF